MPIVIDVERGKQVGELLNNSFSTIGILQKTEIPEDMIPNGMIK